MNNLCRIAFLASACRSFFASAVSSCGGFAFGSRFHSFSHDYPITCPCSEAIAKALCKINPFPPFPDSQIELILPISQIIQIKTTD
ncbi:MAG: hypothetical protein ACK5RM_14275 [Pseudanabaena sp.]